ncbi:MAG: glyceraldehyde 3-phosphate dehydrogenase NAD-binding domain-containing protein [Campylobacterota bacterium]|nr:glyceraldehyde 3-phosphate dehydrogenase NAD-binding domain-containing protein [Campylobacterota bacterium]
MRILLNGVGRVGKSILRLSTFSDSFCITAINEVNTNIENIAYMINYDSTYGKLDDKYKVCEDSIENNSSKIKILNFEKLEDIDFKKYKIDAVIDASGTKVDMTVLENLGLKSVFLTHPNKNAHINVVLGVNSDELDCNKHKIISTSSCNATALLPVLKLIDESVGIQCGNITTIHPLLNHQKVLDSSCIGSDDRDIACNFEFGRSSLQNIIPSKTTTLEACSYVMKSLNDKNIVSSSFRVPTATVGAIDISLITDKKSSSHKLKELFLKYEKEQTYNVILNNNEHLVSSDFIGEKYTTVVDHRFTQVQENLVKLNIWYDNEWGYASKVVDIVDLYISNINNKKGIRDEDNCK